MPISVRKLAQLLGVSPASVSLALNGKPGVSEETREKILAAALQHGLKPVSAPAAVRRSSDITLAVYRKHGSICGDTEFFSAVIEGITTQAAVAGYVHLFGRLGGPAIGGAAPFRGGGVRIAGHGNAAEGHSEIR